MPHQSNSQAMMLGIFLVIFSHSLKKCIVSTLIFSASTSKVLGKKLPHLSDLLCYLKSISFWELWKLKRSWILHTSGRTTAGHLTMMHKRIVTTMVNFHNICRNIAQKKLFTGHSHRTEPLLYVRSFFRTFVPWLLLVYPRHKMQHWDWWYKPMAKMEGIPPTLY